MTTSSSWRVAPSWRVNHIAHSRFSLAEECCVCSVSGSILSTPEGDTGEEYAPCPSVLYGWVVVDIRDDIRFQKRLVRCVHLEYYAAQIFGLKKFFKVLCSKTFPPQKDDEQCFMFEWPCCSIKPHTPLSQFHRDPSPAALRIDGK